MSKGSEQHPATGSHWRRDTGEVVEVVDVVYKRARWWVHYRYDAAARLGGQLTEKLRARFYEQYSPVPSDAQQPSAPYQELLARCREYTCADPTTKPTTDAAKYSALARWVAWMERNGRPCTTFADVREGVLAFHVSLEERGSQRSTRRQYRAALSGFLRWRASATEREKPKAGNAGGDRGGDAQPVTPAALTEPVSDVERLARVLYAATSEKVRDEGLEPVAWEQTQPEIREGYREDAVVALCFLRAQPLPEDVQDMPRRLLETALSEARLAATCLNESYLRDPENHEREARLRSGRAAINNTVRILAGVLE